MKYIITKHSKQRRPHHTPKTDEYLIDWIKAFDNKFDFNSLQKNRSYKIYKGGTAVIKIQNNNVLVLITFSGFNTPVDKFDFNSLIIKETPNRNAILCPIYRINFNEKTVKSGMIDT